MSATLQARPLTALENSNLSPPRLPSTIQILKTFEASLRRRAEQGDIRLRTARHYAADVQQHMDWLEGQGIHPAQAEKWNLEACRDWLVGCYQTTTVRRKLASVRQLYGFLQALGLIPANPAVGLEVPRGQRDTSSKGRGLSRKAVESLLAAPNPGTPKGLRDLAMLRLIAVHGLRVSEIRQLSLGDIDLAAPEPGVVRVLGRSGWWRTVPLVEDTCDTLRAWLAGRSLMKPATDAVFISLHWTAGRSEPGRRISPRGIRQAVDSYLVQIGAKRRGVSCETLRYVMADGRQA